MLLAIVLALIGIVLVSITGRADCISISEAKNHVGETRCITGKVVRVKSGDRGVHYLDFCEDYRTCPFTVVVFPRDLKSVGGVRLLQQFVAERGKIVPRRLTGVCTPHQRRLTSAIKRARNIALLPFSAR